MHYENPPTSITRQAITWNPQGKRKRGWPRNTWRRDMDTELKKTGYTWSEITTMTQSRTQWRAREQTGHSGEPGSKQDTVESQGANRTQWRAREQTGHNGEPGSKQDTVESQGANRTQWRAREQTGYSGEPGSKQDTI